MRGSGGGAPGLFFVFPPPIQILKQFFLGASGEDYITYIVIREITRPLYLEGLYTDKLIYLTNHLFTKGHAMQRREVKIPTSKYIILGLEQFSLNSCGISRIPYG